MASSNRISNHNTLQTTGFSFGIARCPNINWFVQEAIIPGVTLGDASKNSAVGRAAFAGDNLLYDELVLTFAIDENLANWREIYNWMRGLAPTRLEKLDNQYGALKESDFYVVSDGTLTVMTNANNPNIEIYFKDLFPLSLGNVELKTTDTEINVITCRVSFRYTSYDITINTIYNDNPVPDNII